MTYTAKVRVEAGWRAVSFAVSIALGMTSFAAAADERPGSFGFSVSIDGDGFFLNPTVRSITVDTVVVASPAAAAGIVPRDRILEIEGHPVAGSKANALKPYMKRSPGQVLHLRLKRISGEEYDAALTAVPKE